MWAYLVAAVLLGIAVGNLAGALYERSIASSGAGRRARKTAQHAQTKETRA